MSDMKLEKVNYSDLNSRQKEVFNFQKVAWLLAEYGFNCIKLADDWQGADFLAYHKDGGNTLKVQLKGRLTISKKYIGKSIFMTFPIRDTWYLIEHDELVSKVTEHANSWLVSESWVEDGGYSSDKPNSKLVGAIEDSKI